MREQDQTIREERDPPPPGYADELERDLSEMVRGEVRFDPQARALYAYDAGSATGPTTSTPDRRMPPTVADRPSPVRAVVVAVPPLVAASAALACRRIGAGGTTLAPRLGGQRRCDVAGVGASAAEEK